MNDEEMLTGENTETAYVTIEDTVENTEAVLTATPKEKRKYFAQTGWKIALTGFVIQAVEISLSIILMSLLGPKYSQMQWIQYVLIVIGVNLVGFPLFYLLTCKSEKTLPEKKKIKFGWLIIILFICFGVIMIGNIIGMGVNAVILLPFGINPQMGNALTRMISNTSLLNIILGIVVAGIGAPIFEELIFRKLLIDHTLKYGAGASILLSGLFFGLYHGNFGQFFYTFIMGIIFAYVYIYTGNIKNSIFLHMGINMYSAAILLPAMSLIDNNFTAQFMQVVELLKQGDVQAYMDAAVPLIASNPKALIGLYVTGFAVGFEYLMVFAGLILAGVFAKRFFTKIRKSMNMGEKGTKVLAVFNWGSILMISLGVAMFTIYYAQMIVPVIINLIKYYM